MRFSRRTLLKSAAALPVGAQLGALTAAQAQSRAGGAANFRRVAVEEAYMPPELISHWRDVIDRNPPGEKGFVRLASGFLSDRPASRQKIAELTDIGEGRIKAMDEEGIEKQVISINSPGVQPLERDLANAMAILANDQMAEAVRKYPDRFDALATVAPQDPSSAVREIERAVEDLGMKGILINSHTKGEFLDDRKFWPLLEVAEALRVPIYLHPQTPPDSMIEPYSGFGLDSAMWGFSAECALHVMRLIMSGVFDRFPQLTLLLGHAGEGIPFFLDRIDDRYIASLSIFGERNIGQLQRKPSEYLRQNIYVTTSGMNFEDPVMFLIKVLGVDRVLYAADYPHESLVTRRVIDRLLIEDSDKSKIFYENAVRVLSL